MQGIFIKRNGDRLLLTLSKEIYEREAVMTAAYKFTGLCSILIRPLNDNEMEVVFDPKAEGTTQNLEKLASEFCNEALDQQIRLDLEKRYGNIRELIVRHAFSPIKNLTELLNKS